MATKPDLNAARLFVNVAQDLMTQPDLAATRERIVSMAVKLTGCSSAAILTGTPSTDVHVTASTDPTLTASLARAAADTAQGPAAQALDHRQGFASASLRQECRWPRYAQRVLADTAIRSRDCWSGPARTPTASCATSPKS